MSVRDKKSERFQRLMAVGFIFYFFPSNAGLNKERSNVQREIKMKIVLLHFTGKQELICLERKFNSKKQKNENQKHAV